MAVTLSGGRWSTTVFAVPAGGAYPAPFPWTVSCVTSVCVALGAYVAGGGAGALVAETLSGGRWTPTAMPLPAGGSYGFPFTYAPEGSISCADATSCVAVSAFEASGGGQQGLAEILDGGSWVPVSMVAPAGGSSALPEGVSCSGPGSCVAVGSYSSSGGDVSSLVETLSGTTWTPGTVPVPVAAPDATLTGLSCPAPGSCVAVGDVYDVDHVQNPFEETLSSGRWTSQVLRFPEQAVPSGDANPVLQGVSCPSVSVCIAVGYVPGPALAEHPLAEVLSGGTWRPEKLPSPRGIHGQSATLSGIACPSDTSCVAVGVLQSEAAGRRRDPVGRDVGGTAHVPPGQRTSHLALGRFLRLGHLVCGRRCLLGVATRGSRGR